MQANTPFQVGQTARLRIDILPSEGFSANAQVRIVGVENHQPRVEGECPQQAEEQNETLCFLRTFYIVETRSMGTELKFTTVTSCRLRHTSIFTKSSAGRRSTVNPAEFTTGGRAYLGECVVVNQTPRPVTLDPGTHICVTSGPTSVKGGRWRAGEEAFYEFEYGIERPKVIRRTLGCLVHGRDLIQDN